MNISIQKKYWDCQAYGPLPNPVQFEIHVTFCFRVMIEKPNLDEIFCNLRIQSWKKVLGTLSTRVGYCVYVLILSVFF